MTSPGSTPLPAESGPAVRLLSLLGQGRTSRVWLGRLEEAVEDLPAGTNVAVKVLLPDLATDEEARTTLAFEREASLAVNHPTIARARHHEATGLTPPWAGDPGAPGAEHAATDAAVPRPWLLMDLVPGDALDEWIDREGAVPEPIARSLGARVARGLAAMHAAGWVHGDVKPENVRLDAEGRAVLVDLGFARPAGAEEAPLGTPGYLAPERELGGAPAASADLFALGCLLFEAVTGRPAARSDDELAALRTGRARPPSDDQPRVSPLLDALVRSLLQVAPTARPTAFEVATILEEGEASAWWRARIAYDAGARRDTVAWSGAHGLPLAGRDEELALLEEAWKDAGHGGLCVLLTGPRGSGKSRLVAEFVHRLRAGGDAPLYLYGRCHAIGDERPAAPLIALLRRWLHLPSGTHPGERVRALLQQTVAAEVARTLLAAVRPDRGERAGVEMTEAAALASWMLALPRTAPTIVFLDDVQFAGDATLSALHQVARELEKHGLLLVLGLRSQAQIQREGGLSELRGRLAPITRRLDLTPLGEDEVLGIVEQLFHHSVPRLRLARVLHERTGGLPGSIAEILRLAAQRGWTRDVAPPGRGLALLVDPDDLPRPESLLTAVGERLAELPGRSRIWLERLAVLGSRTDLEAIGEAWPTLRVVDRDAALAELVREDWLAPTGRSFRFAHPVEREETIQRTGPARLRRHHLAVARALAGAEARLGRRPTYRRAFHLREAGAAEELLEILPELIRRMRDSGHPHRRATLASWGLEALDALGRRGREHHLRRGLLEALADAADKLGTRTEQRAALEELGEIDLDLEDEPQTALRVYLLHARHAVSRGRFGLARGFLRNAEEFAERALAAAGSGVLELTAEARKELISDRAEIERLTARIESERGDYAAAAESADRALELGEDAASRAEARLISVEVQIHEGDLDAALKGLASARRDLRRQPGGLRERSVRAAMNLVSGRAWRLVGRPARAARAFERAHELSVQTGVGTIEVEVAARRGRLLADIHRVRDAELMLRDALFTARRIEDRRGEALAALFLGILLGEQESEGAEVLVTRAHRLAVDLGLLRIESLALGIRARIARSEGDDARALELARDAWALVERHGAELPDRIVIGGTLALTLAEGGQHGRAEVLERTLRRRIERDNGRLAAGTTRRRHARWSLTLLQSALSPDGPLYPRINLPESVG
ncbi:MAG: AAA family ATPase [Planctomycetota bacterium]|nr:AAA family ATPase [Planctomycetota bacterium]